MSYVKFIDFDNAIVFSSTERKIIKPYIGVLQISLIDAAKSSGILHVFPILGLRCSIQYVKQVIKGSISKYILEKVVEPPGRDVSISQINKGNKVEFFARCRIEIQN